MFYVKAQKHIGVCRWVPRDTRSYTWEQMTEQKSMRLGFERRHMALWFAMKFAEKYPDAMVVIVRKRHCPQCKRSCSCTSS